MTYALGMKSLGYCTRVDPRMMEVAHLAITITEQDFGFTEEQSRTQAYEDELVATGVSHSRASHHIIDCIAPGHWARAGHSGALDAVPWNGSAFVWDWGLIWPVVAAFKRASVKLNIPVTSGTCWDRLLSEIPGDDAAAMKAASDDYVARHGGHAFVDGPHVELGRN